MKPRIEYGAAAPAAGQALLAIENYVRHCGLEPLLLELVRLHA